MVSRMSRLTLSQVVKEGDCLELKILLFLSFQIDQSVKPGRSCQMCWRIGLWKDIVSQFTKVSHMLSRFRWDRHMAWAPQSQI